MEGDLYQHVMYALRKPEKRILGAHKPEKPDAGRMLHEVLNGRLKTSRKFDIDDALMDEVFKQSSWAELTQNEGNLPVKLMTRNIVEAQSELRLPFKHCWLEFSGVNFNKHMGSLGWSGGYVILEDQPKTYVPFLTDSTGEKKNIYQFERIGVLLTEHHDGQIDAYCFHDFSEIDKVYVSMLGRSFKTESRRPPVDLDIYNHMSLLMYGMNFQGEPYAEASDGYLEMLRSVGCIHMEELFGKEYTKQVFEQFKEAWVPYLIRLSWETLRVLNYPWIAREQKRFERSKKGRSPKVTPRDSYYRCKIKLPKPDGVETRQLEPRDEAYGKRLHQVRGHWRVYRDEYGDFVKRTWIKEHRRGDAKLGVVLKDYVLTGGKGEN
ncbi:MAG: hypothetical protein CMO61_00120 [Verrucomicrobiales bacterium]|nr:hypothetical protein [Verrucomicrobiales bacterium]|tara:strand:- start:2171 stop:3304 length:1134 start_codon:yes stop_codon:yes gene_type:complete